MCDYCDCRSHPEIAALSNDHEQLIEMLARLMRAVEADDAAAATAVGEELHKVLDVHAAREERGVFDQLRRVDAPHEYVAMFEHDHHAIHALLHERPSADWRDRACELVGLLRDHILREETDLFPAAHQMLVPTQWDAIAASRAVPAAG